MERDKVIEELLQIADRIKYLTLELQRLGRERQDLQEKYSEIEYRHYTEVCFAVENGKPIYTNEDRRRHEVRHRLRDDKDAIGQRTKRKGLDEKEEQVNSELNRLQDRKLILLVSLGAPIPHDVLEKSEDSKYIT